MLLFMSFWGQTAWAGAAKVQAPVSIEAQVGDVATLVTVRFLAAAQDAVIEIGGVRGFAVAPVGWRGASAATGTVQRFRVPYESSARRGDLAVLVRGSFDGQVRNRSASFRLSAPTRAGASAVLPASTRVSLGSRTQE